MTLAIMQPYLFPYIGYFQLLKAVDKFVIYDDVNYINKGWINRNRISLNGKPHTFTIPVVKASQNKKINELRLSYDNNWRKKISLTIQHAYKKAPYYNQAYPIIERIINKQENKLSSYILNSIYEIKSVFNIDTEITPSSEVYQNEELKGQERIIDICLKEGASTYINPIGGIELYTKQIFNKEDIQLAFLKPHEIIYTQNNHEFIPYLSIIDLMMYQSINEIKELLNQYKLIY